MLFYSIATLNTERDIPDCYREEMERLIRSHPDYESLFGIDEATMTPEQRSNRSTLLEQIMRPDLPSGESTDSEDMDPTDIPSFQTAEDLSQQGKGYLEDKEVDGILFK